MYVAHSGEVFGMIAEQSDTMSMISSNPIRVAMNNLSNCNDAVNFTAYYYPAQ